MNWCRTRPYGRDAAFVLVDPDLDELPPALSSRGVHFVRG